ncbi:MAG: S53 family peptidase [Sciscionella sp.]
MDDRGSTPPGRVGLTRLGIGVSAATLALAAAAGTAAAQSAATPSVVSSHSQVNLGCNSAPAAGHARCMAVARADTMSNGSKHVRSSAAPSGLGPSDIQSAYNLAGATSGGGTVAIVDAMDDPNAESDLQTYRSNYGLPECSSSNGCFTKVNQDGQSSPLPTGDSGWGGEITLDLDAVSAACPDCKILLVEANSSSMNDLGAAVNTAAKTSGVVAISNSYGGGESSGQTTADQQYFTHSGVAITASTGDNGYGVSFPASSPGVTAVGGTTLNKDSSQRGWSETAWSGAGSGCSSVEPKPSWQTDQGCANRAVADVSAVADPQTGLAIYDTYGEPGWIQVGGTSLSSPLIASVYALAGNTSSISNGAYPYAHTDALNDVTSGSNGSCGTQYLCNAGQGYDGPTGLGTPSGTGAF